MISADIILFSTTYTLYIIDFHLKYFIHQDLIFWSIIFKTHGNVKRSIKRKSRKTSDNKAEMLLIRSTSLSSLFLAFLLFCLQKSSKAKTSAYEFTLFATVHVFTRTQSHRCPPCEESNRDWKRNLPVCYVRQNDVIQCWKSSFWDSDCCLSLTELSSFSCFD